MMTSSTLENVALGLEVTLFSIWLVLALFLVIARPRSVSLTEVLRLLPDCIRLLRGLMGDDQVPWPAKITLGLLAIYLALPFDLIPDFIPVIGLFDDVIIICLVLRVVARSAGAEAIRRNWSGTEPGLAAITQAVGFPPGDRDGVQQGLD